MSKQHLDKCMGSQDQRVVNDATGWDAVIAMFKQAEVDLVVIEATGGYERGLVNALQGAGIAVARVNPRQARDFAKSMGALAKTDRVDARILRDFADVLARHKDRSTWRHGPRDVHGNARVGGQQRRELRVQSKRVFLRAHALPSDFIRPRRRPGSGFPRRSRFVPFYLQEFVHMKSTKLMICAVAATAASFAFAQSTTPSTTSSPTTEQTKGQTPNPATTPSTGTPTQRATDNMGSTGAAGTTGNTGSSTMNRDGTTGVTGTDNTMGRTDASGMRSPTDRNMMGNERAARADRN